MILYCITTPSKSHISGRAIIYSSIRALSRDKTIEAFLGTHSERTWEQWVSDYGYDCVPLHKVSNILLDRLIKDRENYNETISS